ncbi:MAG: metal-dependent transcriptional regulator [Acidobacteriota bacterium]
MVTSTVEDYLKCILLEQPRGGGGLVSMGQIATALRVTNGTVTSMVKTLADSNLVTYEPYSGVRLTPAGLQLAGHVLRRHRLVELFLVKVLGLDWSEVHDEAERLEHVISERVVERMDELLGFPTVDPHGDPIPGPRGVVEEPDLPSLLLCPVKRRVRVARITDQSPEFLRLAEARGLMPGRIVTVSERDETADAVQLRREGGERISLGFRAASKVLVEPTS